MSSIPDIQKDFYKFSNEHTLPTIRFTDSSPRSHPPSDLNLPSHFPDSDPERSATFNIDEAQVYIYNPHRLIELITEEGGENVDSMWLVSRLLREGKVVGYE